MVEASDEQQQKSWMLHLYEFGYMVAIYWFSSLTVTINSLLLKCLCYVYANSSNTLQYSLAMLLLLCAVWRKHSKNFMAICWFFSDFWSFFYGRYNNCYNLRFALNQFLSFPYVSTIPLHSSPFILLYNPNIVSSVFPWFSLTAIHYELFRFPWIPFRFDCNFILPLCFCSIPFVILSYYFVFADVHFCISCTIFRL